ncbi:MAG: hypothetical protein Q8P50_03760 [Bacillota bacterium]|nr:hypothetical protein [Bacillota bacterium]
MESAERQGIRFVGHSDMGGTWSTMQVMLKDHFAYVGRSQDDLPMLIVDISDPRNPQVVGELPCYPRTRHSKCQTNDNLLLVNYEQPRGAAPGGRSGWAVFDISRPAEPRELAFVDTGGIGVHRIWWAGERYCYVFGRPQGFRERMLEIYDLQRPDSPQLVGRWWSPGLWAGGNEPQPDKNLPNALIHHGIYNAGHLYCGHWDAGLLFLDVSNPEKPQEISRLAWEKGGGGKTHTALPLPGRKLLAVTDESGQAGKPQTPKCFRVVDIADERAPRVLSVWRPDPAVFEIRGGRVGAHNLHENRPGTYQSETVIFATFPNAGLRVLDITDPVKPCEIAYYVEPAGPGQEACEGNDVLVTKDGLILLTDRFGGLHILQME